MKKQYWSVAHQKVICSKHKTLQSAIMATKKCYEDCNIKHTIVEVTNEKDV